MVSLFAKRLIRITHVLDHKLQKAKQVVQDHCFFVFLFSYLLTDKKKNNCLVCVGVYSNPLGQIFPQESYFEWTSTNIIRYIACWTRERTDRVRQFERELKTRVAKEPASLSLYERA